MCIRDRLKDELTSIRQLSPNSSLVKYMSELRGSPNVPVHSIIGDRGRNDTPNASDGVAVSYTHLAMTIICKALCRLLAPILAVTADEAWEYAGYEGSVHEQDFPAPMPEYDTQEASSVISRLQEIRSVIRCV